jgi:hypothetical protein
VPVRVSILVVVCSNKWLSLEYMASVNNNTIYKIPPSAVGSDNRVCFEAAMTRPATRTAEPARTYGAPLANGNPVEVEATRNSYLFDIFTVNRFSTISVCIVKVRSWLLFDQRASRLPFLNHW